MGERGEEIEGLKSLFKLEEKSALQKGLIRVRAKHFVYPFNFYGGANLSERKFLREETLFLKPEEAHEKTKKIEAICGHAIEYSIL